MLKLENIQLIKKEIRFMCITIRIHVGKYRNVLQAQIYVITLYVDACLEDGNKDDFIYICLEIKRY